MTRAAAAPMTSSFICSICSCPLLSLLMIYLTYYTHRMGKLNAKLRFVSSVGIFPEPAFIVEY